jgi:hypothetical protein
VGDRCAREVLGVVFTNGGQEELWGDTLALFVDGVFQDLTSPIVQRHVDIVRLQDTDGQKAVYEAAWLANDQQTLLPALADFDRRMAEYTRKFGSGCSTKRKFGSTPASQPQPPTRPKVDESRKKTQQLACTYVPGPLTAPLGPALGRIARGRCPRSNAASPVVHWHRGGPSGRGGPAAGRLRR